MVIPLRLCSRFFVNNSVNYSSVILKPARPQVISRSFHSYSQSRSFLPQPVPKILGIMCCFGVGGGAYAYFTAPSAPKQNMPASLLDTNEPYILTSTPKEPVSRKVVGPANIGLRMTLYQYQSCPFCCKVRAFLDYYGISYDVIEVNPVMRKQLKFSKYRKVPILIAQDEKTGQVFQLNDSSVILSVLGTLLLSNGDKLPDVLSLYPPVSYKTPEGKEVTEVLNQYFLMYRDSDTSNRTEEIRNEMQWRKWADQEFVHVLSPNIYRSPGEALQSFNQFSKVGEWEKNFSTLERMTVIYVGAVAMFFIGNKLKRKYALKDDVRESLYDSCKLWMKNVGKSGFMGGSSPNLADLSMYGLLSSIEGCTAFQDMLKNTNIGTWYYSMKDLVKTHNGYKEHLTKYQS